MCGTQSGPERAGMLIQHISSPESSVSAGLMAAIPKGGTCLLESTQLSLPAHVDALAEQPKLAGFDIDAAASQSSGRREVRRSTTWPKQRMMCVIHEDGLQQTSNTVLGDAVDYELEQALCAAAAPSSPPYADAAAAGNVYAAAASAVSTEQALPATTLSPAAAAITTAWPVLAHSSSSSGGAVPARRRGLIKRQSSATTGRELMRSAGVTFADQAVGTTLSGRRRSLDTASFDTRTGVQTEALPPMVPSTASAAAAAPVAAAPAGHSELNPHHRLPKRRASAPHLGFLPGAMPNAVPARVPTVLASAHAPSCQCTECLCAKTAHLVQQLKQQQQQQPQPSMQHDRSAAMRTGSMAHQPSGLSPQGSLTPGQPGGHLPGAYLQGSAALQGATCQGSAVRLPGVYQQQGAAAVQGGLMHQRSLSPGHGSAGQLAGVYQQQQGLGLQQQGSGLQQQGAVGAEGGLWLQSSLPSLATGTQPTHWNGQQAAGNMSEPLPGFADGTTLQMPQLPLPQQQQQQGLMHWGSGSMGANHDHSPTGSYAAACYADKQSMAFDPLSANTSEVGLVACQGVQRGEVASQTAMLPKTSYEGHANHNMHSNNSNPLPLGPMVSSASMAAAAAAAATPALSNYSGSVTAATSPNSSTGVAAQRHLAQSIATTSLTHAAGQQQQQPCLTGQQQQQDMLRARQQLLQVLQQRRQQRQQLLALQQQQHAAALQQQQQQYQHQQQYQQQHLGRQHTSAAAAVLAAARSNPEQVLGMLLQKAKHITLTPSQLEKLHRVVQLKQQLVASKAMLARASNMPGQAVSGQGATGSCAAQQQQQQQQQQPQQLQQGLCPPNWQQPCCQNVDNELQQMIAMAQADVTRQPQNQQQQRQGPGAGWPCAGGGVATGAVAAMWQQSAAAAALGDPGAGIAAMPLWNGSGSSSFPLQQQVSLKSPSLQSQGSNNHSSSLQQQQEQQELVAETGGFGSFTALLQDPLPADIAAAANVQPSTSAAAAAAVGLDGVSSLQQLADLDLGDLGDDLDLTLDLNELDVSSFVREDDLIGFVNEMVGADETYLSVQAELTKEQQRREKLTLYQQQVEKYQRLQQQQQQQQQQPKDHDALSNSSASQAGCSAAAAVAACPSLNTGSIAADAAADDWLDQYSLGLTMEQDVLKMAL